jgi:hypothetical protein
MRSHSSAIRGPGWSTSVGLLFIACLHEHDEVTAEMDKRGSTFIGRDRAAIGRMFNGKELVDPGLVQISYWRPDGGQPDRNADRVCGYCGVART